MVYFNTIQMLMHTLLIIITLLLRTAHFIYQTLLVKIIMNI